MGPYTIEQINEYLAQGSLLPTDYAWHEGLPDWVPVTEISGVGSAAAPPPFNPAQAPAVATEGNTKKKKLLLIGGIVGGVALIAALALVLLKGSDKETDAKVANSEKGDTNRKNEYIGIWLNIPENRAFIDVRKDGTVVFYQLKNVVQSVNGTWDVKKGELYVMGVEGMGVGKVSDLVFKIDSNRENLEFVRLEGGGYKKPKLVDKIRDSDIVVWELTSDKDPRIKKIKNYKKPD